MFFRKPLLFLFCLSITIVSIAQDSSAITESMGNIKLSFLLDEKGSPTYAVSYKQKAVINPSQMGFVLENKKTFNSDFILLGSEKNLWMKHGRRCGVR